MPSLKKLDLRLNRMERLLTSVGLLRPGSIGAADLSAISADLGTITAGAIVVGVGTKDVDLTGIQLDSAGLYAQNAGVNQVYIPASSGYLTAGTANVFLRLFSSGLVLYHYSNDTTGSLYYLYKARGTAASPANVQDGDVIAEMIATSYVGGFNQSGSLNFEVDGAPGTNAPNRLIIYLGGAASAPVERLRLDNTGNLTVTGAVSGALGQLPYVTTNSISIASTTTTSTSLADIANSSFTIAGAGTLLITATLCLMSSAAATDNNFHINLDTSDVALGYFNPHGALEWDMRSVQYIGAVGTGTHTIKMRWATSAGTLSLSGATFRSTVIATLFKTGA